MSPRLRLRLGGLRLRQSSGCAEDPRRHPLERCDRRDHQYQVSEALRSPRNAIGGLALGDESTGDNKITPNGSLLFSDTFADDRFGILVDGGYADSKVRGNHINIQGWEGGNPAAGGGLAPCQLTGAGPCAVAPRLGRPARDRPRIKDWFIQDYGIYQEHNEDKRVGGRFVLQARPVDGLEMTLDDNYSKETLVQHAAGLQRLVQQHRFDGRAPGARRHGDEFHAAGYAHGLSGTDQPSR